MLKRITSAILPITTQIGATACGHGRRSAVASNYPAWAPLPHQWKPRMRYAAMDSDGAVFQYQYRPKPIHKRWYAVLGQSIAFAMHPPVENWREMIVKRKDMNSGIINR